MAHGVTMSAPDPQHEAAGLAVAAFGLVAAAAVAAAGFDRLFACGFWPASCTPSQQARSDSGQGILLLAPIVGFAVTLLAQWTAEQRLRWGRMFGAWGAALATAWCAWAGGTAEPVRIGLVTGLPVAVFASVLIPAEDRRHRVGGAIAATLAAIAVGGDHLLVGALAGATAVAVSPLVPRSAGPSSTVA
jgi:hypothetical protein